MDVIVIVMLAFTVWFVLGIVDILVNHFSTHYFAVGLCNKIRVVVLVILMGCIVAYCGVTT